MKASEILEKLGFVRDENPYYGEYFSNTISGEQLKRYFSADADRAEEIENGALAYAHIRISLTHRFVEVYRFNFDPDEQDIANAHPDEDDFDGVLEWIAEEYILQEEIVEIDCSIEELIENHNFSFSSEDEVLFESAAFDGFVLRTNYRAGNPFGVVMQAEIKGEAPAVICELHEDVWGLLVCEEEE